MEVGLASKAEETQFWLKHASDSSEFVRLYLHVPVRLRRKKVVLRRHGSHAFQFVVEFYLLIDIYWS